MSETLRNRNASMPDCTLSGARTKKAVETAVHVDRGRSTITWKTLRVYAQFPRPRRLIMTKKNQGNEKTETQRLRHTNTKDTKCYTLKIR